MSYRRIKQYRQERKKVIIDAFGGKCGICGYCGCSGALDLHHLDPNTKEINVSQSILAWKKTILELRKCILLCSNCHREIHSGYTEIPKDVVRFDEEFVSYYEKVEEQDECPICGTMKPKSYKTCSSKCSAKNRRKVDWENYDLEKELKKKNINQVAKELNISWNAVNKGAKKLGLK